MPRAIKPELGAIPVGLSRTTRGIKVQDDADAKRPLIWGERFQFSFPSEDGLTFPSPKPTQLRIVLWARQSENSPVDQIAEEIVELQWRSLEAAGSSTPEIAATYAVPEWLDVTNDQKEKVARIQIQVAALNESSDKKQSVHRILPLLHQTHLMSFTVKSAADLSVPPPNISAPDIEPEEITDVLVSTSWGSKTLETASLALSKDGSSLTWDSTSVMWVDREWHADYRMLLEVKAESGAVIGHAYVDADVLFTAASLQELEFEALQKKSDKPLENFQPRSTSSTTVDAQGIRTVQLTLDLVEGPAEGDHSDSLLRTPGQPKEAPMFLSIAQEKPAASVGVLECSAVLTPRSVLEERLVESSLERFDMDKDGFVDPHEFRALIGMLHVDGTLSDKEINDFFTIVDDMADKDGKMDKDDLTILLRLLETRSLAHARRINELLTKGGNVTFVNLMSRAPPAGVKFTNRIIDRGTGEVVQEHVPAYIKIALQAMSGNAAGRYIFQKANAQDLIRQLTTSMASKYETTESAEFIEPFIKMHNINVEEIERPVDEYKTFNAFFSRKLKPSARPLAEPSNSRVAVSPADCRAMVFPVFKDAKRFWVKGVKFSVGMLLEKHRRNTIARYTGGSLLIARLAPQDYHWWHVPVGGTLGKHWRVDKPGALHSVNPISVNSPVDVFTDNVRECHELWSQDFGYVMMVIVGAAMVGSINVTRSPGDVLCKGDDHGFFAFGGSTVLLLFEKDRIGFDEDLIKNSEENTETILRCRSRIGVATSNPQEELEKASRDERASRMAQLDASLSAAVDGTPPASMNMKRKPSLTGVFGDEKDPDDSAKEDSLADDDDLERIFAESSDSEVDPDKQEVDEIEAEKKEAAATAASMPPPPPPPSIGGRNLTPEEAAWEAHRFRLDLCLQEAKRQIQATGKHNPVVAKMDAPNFLRWLGKAWSALDVDDKGELDTLGLNMFVWVNNGKKPHQLPSGPLPEAIKKECDLILSAVGYEEKGLGSSSNLHSSESGSLRKSLVPPGLKAALAGDGGSSSSLQTDLIRQRDRSHFEFWDFANLVLPPQYFGLMNFKSPPRTQENYHANTKLPPAHLRFDNDEAKSAASEPAAAAAPQAAPSGVQQLPAHMLRKMKAMGLPLPAGQLDPDAAPAAEQPAAASSAEPKTKNRFEKLTEMELMNLESAIQVPKWEATMRQATAQAQKREMHQMTREALMKAQSDRDDDPSDKKKDDEQKPKEDNNMRGDEVLVPLDRDSDEDDDPLALKPEVADDADDADDNADDADSGAAAGAEAGKGAAPAIQKATEAELAAAAAAFDLSDEDELHDDAHQAAYNALQYDDNANPVFQFG